MGTPEKTLKWDVENAGEMKTVLLRSLGGKHLIKVKQLRGNEGARKFPERGYLREPSSRKITLLKKGSGTEENSKLRKLV